jgi:uncharacterized membrane protein
MTTDFPSPAKNPSGLTAWQMYALIGQMGYLIAIPAFVFGFGGAYLDRRFDTSPWLMIAGLALAMMTSLLGVYRIVKRIMSQDTLSSSSR